MNAHVAPGLTWGAAWWFLAHAGGGRQARRYSSGWILLALAAGFAIAGERGWMQWPHFFSGQLATNYAKGEFVPISRAYGFLWLFIAGSAWAGLPACVLAWCGSGRPTRAWEWALRIACGFGGAYLAWRIFAAYPRVFLPLYDSIREKYMDFHANPNLAKLYRDNGSSLRHVGFCLGFLAFELGRRDWKNVKLILTVGLATGLGWAACQNWRWAAGLWPGAAFNFGRCWEASAGVCIGVGFGLAYYWANRRVSLEEASEATPRDSSSCEWLVASGLLLLIGLTLFWPAPQDLRRPSSLPGDGTHYAWGAICLAASLVCGGVAQLCDIGRRQSSGQSGQRIRWVLVNYRQWAELVLILVLGWFIKTQMASEYGDGVADGKLAGCFGPGSAYFTIALLYVATRVPGLLRESLGASALARRPESAEREPVDPAREWLATYLGLSVIALWCLSVGLVNGWQAPVFFGIIVAAFGVAYYGRACRRDRPGTALNGNWRLPPDDPALERWGLCLGLVYGLGLSLRKALKGGANLYVGNEDTWDSYFWNWVSAGMLACLVIGMFWILRQAKRREVPGEVFPHAYGIIWLVLIAQNVLAQVVTGPLVGPRLSWSEFAFSIFYAILFLLTAVIVFHYRLFGQLTSPAGRPPGKPPSAPGG
jgi:hypothetical protein